MINSYLPEYIYTKYYFLKKWIIDKSTLREYIKNTDDFKMKL